MLWLVWRHSLCMCTVTTNFVTYYTAYFLRLNPLKLPERPILFAMKPANFMVRICNIYSSHIGSTFSQQNNSTVNVSHCSLPECGPSWLSLFMVFMDHVFAIAFQYPDKLQSKRITRGRFKVLLSRWKFMVRTLKGTFLNDYAERI